MLRIAHRLAQTWIYQSGVECFRRNGTTIDRRPHSIICDNVAEYVAEHETKFEWEWSEMPGSVPPWQEAIYEWREPRQWNTRNGRSESDKGFQQMGAVVNASLVTDENRERYKSDILKRIKEKSIEWRDRFARLTDDAKWDVCFQPIYVVNGGLGMGYFAGTILVDDSGTPLGSWLYLSEWAPKDISAEWSQDLKSGMKTIATIICLANGMINCKNVSLIDSTKKDAPPAKWQRRMKTPEIRYSRIKIDGFTSEAKSQGGGIDGHNKAWHICRGNFATYTDAAPLFGKYIGRYWRPQHVRGDKKHGEVHSTHEISRPKT